MRYFFPIICTVASADNLCTLDEATGLGEVLGNLIDGIDDETLTIAEKFEQAISGTDLPTEYPCLPCFEWFLTASDAIGRECAGNETCSQENGGLILAQALECATETGVVPETETTTASSAEMLSTALVAAAIFAALH